MKNKISILVIDDEIDICKMVSEILKDEVFNAIIANNYIDASDIIENHNNIFKLYTHIIVLFLPPSSDFTSHHKHRNRYYRGVARSSARYPALRVAAGRIAKISL